MTLEMIDLFWSIFGILFTLVIEAVLIWKFGPKISYGVFYWLNKKSKSTRNIPIKIHFFRNSSNTNQDILVKDIREKLIKNLHDFDVQSVEHGGDIQIHNYKYASTNIHGYIRFSYSSFKKDSLSSISFQFTKDCYYNTLSDDIFGLVNAVKSLEDILRFIFPNDVIFTDILKCPLKNLEYMTGILERLNKVQSGEVFNYIYFSNDLKIELLKNEIVLSQKIETEGILLLKEFITMYY